MSVIHFNHTNAEIITYKAIYRLYTLLKKQDLTSLSVSCTATSHFCDSCFLENGHVN
jgi:hypothetical protein